MVRASWSRSGVPSNILLRVASLPLSMCNNYLNNVTNFWKVREEGSIKIPRYPKTAPSAGFCYSQWS